MIDKFLAVCVVWLLGAPIYLPWLLSRLGFYKGWYLAPSMPPFVWRGSIHLWPLSAVFVCYPLIALSPLNDDAVMKVWAGVGIASFILTLVLGVCNPRWAKPAWQRRLEDRYSHDEIATFVRVWRQMNRKEWGRLIETEEGLKQLVERAGGQYRRGPKPPAGPDDDCLWLVK
jgi:hypothetical protein